MPFLVGGRSGISVGLNQFLGKAKPTIITPDHSKGSRNAYSGWPREIGKPRMICLNIFRSCHDDSRPTVLQVQQKLGLELLPITRTLIDQASFLITLHIASQKLEGLHS